MARHPVPEVLATILPAAVSKRRLPCNFDERDRSLFQHELEHDIPSTYLLRFRDVLVSAEGLILKGLKLLPESFAYSFELKDWKRSSIAKLLATNYFMRHRRSAEMEVLWITDYWSKGYFHWLTDALPRLFVMRNRLHELTLTLPWEFERRDFVRASLDAFGVKSVDFIKQNEVLECGSLLMPTHTAPSGHFREQTIRGVRSILLSAFGNTKSQTQKRVYISRRAAGKRRVANEQEIIPILTANGFEIVCAEELTFEQQVALASQTRYLVSNHGAGLANTLFMPERGRVLELRHRTDYVNNCYFVMSSALDLDYFYQLCDAQQQGEDPHSADLIVDPGEIQRNLTVLLRE